MTRTHHANRLLCEVLAMRFCGRIPGWQITRMERRAWNNPRRHEPRAWENRARPMSRFWARRLKP
jgi:hypothetical protein